MVAWLLSYCQHALTHPLQWHCGCLCCYYMMVPIAGTPGGRWDTPAVFAALRLRT